MDGDLHLSERSKISQELEIILSTPVPAFTFQFRSGRQGVGAEGGCGENLMKMLPKSKNDFMTQHLSISPGNYTEVYEKNNCI